MTLGKGNAVFQSHFFFVYKIVIIVEKLKKEL